LGTRSAASTTNWFEANAHQLAKNRHLTNYSPEGRKALPYEEGLIVEETIALRPYPALKLFRDAMYAALKDKLPPDVWDYPTL
jgi:hypothetical protein